MKWKAFKTIFVLKAFLLIAGGLRFGKNKVS